MVAFEGHFDGRVIVPDEPLNLPPNQRLIIQVQPMSEARADFRKLIGIGNRLPENPKPRFASHRDLWE